MTSHWAASGAAVGLVVGTSLAPIAPRVTDGDRSGLALVAAGLFLGLLLAGVLATTLDRSVAASPDRETQR